MPEVSPAREWFILGDGIDREVLTANIQRCLGPDALVRTGRATDGNQERSGFWITAHRDLTSEMIRKLKLDSQHRREQREQRYRPTLASKSTLVSSSRTPKTFSSNSNIKDTGKFKAAAYGSPGGVAEEWAADRNAKETEDRLAKKRAEGHLAENGKGSKMVQRNLVTADLRLIENKSTADAQEQDEKITGPRQLQQDPVNTPEVDRRDFVPKLWWEEGSKYQSEGPTPQFSLENAYTKIIDNTEFYPLQYGVNPENDRVHAQSNESIDPSLLGTYPEFSEASFQTQRVLDFQTYAANGEIILKCYPSYEHNSPAFQLFQDAAAPPWNHLDMNSEQPLPSNWYRSTLSTSTEGSTTAVRDPKPPLYTKANSQGSLADDRKSHSSLYDLGLRGRTDMANNDTLDLAVNGISQAEMPRLISLSPSDSNNLFRVQKDSAFEEGDVNVRPVPSKRVKDAPSSLTGSSVFSKGFTAQSTQATSIDRDEVPQGPSTVTLYNYSTPNDTTVNQSEEDLESVKSLADEILSQTGTLPGVTKYQDVAAQYIVKVLVEDQELLNMYEDAIQKTDKRKFVKNHEKLLHRFFLDIRSKGQVPSEISAIRFMARKTRRELISSEIYDIVAPSNDSMRAKIQIRLDRDHSRAHMVARWLADQDSAESATLAEKSIEPEPQEDIKDSGSESDYEPAEKDTLSKLESAAEFLFTGQPYHNYKESLQAFLHPVSPRAKRHHHELPLEALPNQLIQRIVNNHQNGDSDPAETQQMSTNPPEFLTTGASTDCSLQSKESNPNSHLRQAQRPFLISCPQFALHPSLPMLVNSMMMYLPFPYFEHPVPEGKVRARWTCGCGTRLFDDFTELEPGAVQELEAELQASTSSKTIRSVGQAVYDASAQVVQTIKQLLGQGNTQNAEQNPAEMSLPSYSVPNNATENIDESEVPDLLSPYLLLCVDQGSTNTTLYQRQLKHIKQDRELFEFLQSQYLELNKTKRWFTIKSFGRLSLSQFQVDYSNYADVYKHDATCITSFHERSQDLTSCVCLPPEEKIDHEYLCRPAPKKKLRIVPAIGPRKLTHDLLHPECIKSGQETVLAQLPKRVGLHGLLEASPQEEVIGWGLHFEEGWHWPTICFIFAVLVSFSLLFGVIWSVKRNDIQGGFAVSGFVLAFCGLIGGAMVYR